MILNAYLLITRSIAMLIRMLCMHSKKLEMLRIQPVLFEVLTNYFNLITSYFFF